MSPLRARLLLVAAVVCAAPSALGQQITGEPIEFLSNGARVRGHFLRGTGAAPRPTLLLFHGYPGGMGDVLGIGRAVSAAGWNTLVYLPRGMHESDGVFTLANTLDDFVPALAHLRSRAAELEVDTARLAAGGYSFGGWVALMGAAEHPELRCVATVGPANQGLTARMMRSDPAYLAFIRGVVEPPMLDGRIRAPGWEAAQAEMFDRMEDYDLRLQGESLRDRPVLVIGGWQDQGPTLDGYIVPLVRALRAAGNERITPIAVDDTHAFKRTRQQVQDAVVAWLEKECR